MEIQTVVIEKIKINKLRQDVFNCLKLLSSENYSSFDREYMIDKLEDIICELQIINTQ